MTIPATPRRSPVYVGNGVSPDYAFGFKVLDPETVVVTVADENDLNLQVLDYLVDYTVTLNPDQDSAPGGEVHYADLPVGHRLVVTSDTESSQPTSITNLGAFHANVLEGAIDRLAILHQQQEEKLGRCLQVAVTSELDPAEQLATSLDQAANSASAAAVSAGDALLSEQAAAGSAGDALLSEQAAAGSASDAEGFKDDAAGSAGDAEGFKDDAEDAAALAAEWATKLVDPVAGGEYSAKFHAQEAQAQAQAAALSAASSVPTVQFDALGAESPAALLRVAAGYALSFPDGASAVNATWYFRAPPGFPAAIKARLGYYTSTNSGNVRVAVAVQAIADTEGVVSESYDTANIADIPASATNNTLRSTEIALTNKDGAAAGELIGLRLVVTRNHANDTCTGVFNLLFIEIVEDA